MLSVFNDWLFEKSPHAAQRLVGVLEASFAKLADLPDRGRAVDLGVRELVVPFGGSNYLISYEVKEVGVFVARIWHGLEDRQS
ncbi:type II toxin-antitoxin system RelE/ParE family toxin [Caulobacter soli]|uniref:type II toxin-antitoxin system RelE/ParE family toxin n=1 Tax=Caulobacter soli TaxID=2708539 RepID=UPI0013EAA8D0|nr:type II toxin-antitoxin system RelE/ParE family toxin [Caulobacter soli]